MIQSAKKPENSRKLHVVCDKFWGLFFIQRPHYAATSMAGESPSSMPRFDRIKVIFRNCETACRRIALLESGPMKSQPHILVVSKDLRLMQARKLVLGTYFDVKTAGRLSEAAEILSSTPFDLVVLCDSLSDRERSEVARLAEHRQPRPTLLSIQRAGADGQEAVVGGPMICTRGPLELLKKCADALGVILSLNPRGQAGHAILQQF